MNQKISFSRNMLDVMFAESLEEFTDGLSGCLADAGTGAFSVWQCDGNLCEVIASRGVEINGGFDLFDLGYTGEDISPGKKVISFFDEDIPIQRSLFLRRDDYVLGAICVHDESGSDTLQEVVPLAPYIARRMHELVLRERQMDIYVDYQKKIDFIKKGSRIFTAIELDTVIAMSLDFFMEVFSAEAICAVLPDQFIGYGISESDIRDSMTFGGEPISKMLGALSTTEFFEDGLHSDKFNVTNMFVVYERTLDVRFVMFNIRFDIVPDKEFSDLVSSVVAIAVENARSHERMTAFKVEETEMTKTVEILNRFVSREIYVPGVPEVYGVNFPATKAGGDYCIVQESGDRVFFCIADVCGKGYSAAVFTVALSVFAETLFLGSTCEPSRLPDLVTSINRFLIGKNFGDRFITAFFGIFDKSTRELSYVSCGHEPGFFYPVGESCRHLDSQYIPLGIMEETYTERTQQVNPGDVLFVYTDGVIEYVDHSLLVDQIDVRGDWNAENPLQKLYRELVSEPVHQKDDFTCLLMKF